MVTLDQVRADNPRVAIDSETVPNESQVEDMVDQVEAEVRSYLEQRDLTWPTVPDSTATRWVTRTVLDGVKMRLLAEVFALEAELPESVRVARTNYNDRLRRLQFNLVPASVFEESTRTSRYSGPLLGYTADAPRVGETFQDWTLRRAEGAGGRVGYPA